MGPTTTGSRNEGEGSVGRRLLARSRKRCTFLPGSSLRNVRKAGNVRKAEKRQKRQSQQGQGQAGRTRQAGTGRPGRQRQAQGGTTPPGTPLCTPTPGYTPRCTTLMHAATGCGVSGKSPYRHGVPQRFV